jgi:serine/threonine protein kinase
MLPSGDRVAEIVGTDGERLFWLIEGDNLLSPIPSQTLEFLSMEDFKLCPRCGWAIPDDRYVVHELRCPFALQPPAPPQQPQGSSPAGPAPAGGGGFGSQRVPVVPAPGPNQAEERIIEGEALRPGPYSEIKQLELLGQGAQGKVWKCLARSPSGEKALIVVKEMCFPTKEVNQFDIHLSRCRDLMKLDHTHLIRYLDVQATREPCPTISIIMPFYKESDLSAFINSRPKPVPEYDLCSLVLQIAQALKYLHARNLAHCDVKPDNILMFENCTRTLLMDLDTARNVSGGGKTVLGTMEYMAPEVMSGAGYSTQCDVWSLGVVTFTLMALPEFPMLECPGQAPAVLNFQGWDPVKLREALIKTVNERSKNSYSRGLLQLVCDMIEHDPKKRPTASVVCDRLMLIMTQLLVPD